MKLLDHYIMRSVLSTLLVALLVLAGMDTLFSFIAELEDLSDTYKVANAAIYSAATLPRRAYEFIPIATLIGCLLSLGMLASNSELVVMRASGVSVGRIIYSVLKAVMVVVVLGLVLGQFVMPNTERYAQSYRALQQGGGVTLKVNHGNWHRDRDTIVHINALAPKGVVLGVTRYRIDKDNHLIETGFSQKATYLGGEDQKNYGLWRLENNRLTYLAPDRIEVNTAERQPWQTNLDPKLINLVVLKPDYLSITGLYKYTEHMQQAGLSFQSYELAFWKKIMQPFATIAMILLAVSFVFGPLRSVTVGYRVMVGLITGLIFNYTQELSGYSSLVFNVEQWVAAIVPVAVFALVGLIMILRVR